MIGIDYRLQAFQSDALGPCPLSSVQCILPLAPVCPCGACRVFILGLAKDTHSKQDMVACVDLINASIATRMMKDPLPWNKAVVPASNLIGRYLTVPLARTVPPLTSLAIGDPRLPKTPKTKTAKDGHKRSPSWPQDSPRPPQDSSKMADGTGTGLP